MTSKISSEVFRSVFKLIEKDLLHWFPGHMDRGLKQMQQKLRSVDCVIEVHDARIPLSGINTDFKYKIGGIKPHILVLNKIDLIDKKLIPRITKKLSNEYPHILFTNCRDRACKGMQKLFPLAQDLIKKTDRFNRSGEDNCCLMIIGIPNVGKSSIINALRIKYLHKGNATPMGPIPGVTRSVLHKIKISENPLFYLLDTPGILNPKISSIDTGLKLALCATIQDHLVGDTIIADYLLFWLNKHQRFQYVKHFELEQATDDILVLLNHISKKFNKVIKHRNYENAYVNKPDLEAAAKIVLKAYRVGELGNFVLDEDEL